MIEKHFRVPETTPQVLLNLQKCSIPTFCTQSMLWFWEALTSSSWGSELRGASIGKVGITRKSSVWTFQKYIRAFHQVIRYIMDLWSNVEKKRSWLERVIRVAPWWFWAVGNLSDIYFLNVLCCGWTHNSTWAPRYIIFCQKVSQNHVNTS